MYSTMFSIPEEGGNVRQRGRKHWPDSSCVDKTATKCLEQCLGSSLPEGPGFPGGWKKGNDGIIVREAGKMKQ